MKVARQFTAWNSTKEAFRPRGTARFDPFLYGVLGLRTPLTRAHHAVPLGRAVFFSHSRQWTARLPSIVPSGKHGLADHFPPVVACSLC
jgi:hypothetical protein